MSRFGFFSHIYSKMYWWHVNFLTANSFLVLSNFVPGGRMLLACGLFVEWESGC